MISINFEDVCVDDMRIAVKLLELIEESQSIRKKFGSEPNETNDKRNFHSQLVDLITEKLVDYYNHEGEYPWSVFLKISDETKKILLREVVEKIIQLEDEALGELSGE